MILRYLIIFNLNCRFREVGVRNQAVSDELGVSQKLHRAQTARSLNRVLGPIARR